MLLEAAVEGVLGGFGDPAREVNVCRLDDDALHILVDADDSVQRMLALFGFLLVARQVDDFLGLLWPKAAMECDDAGRKFVIDPPASRAERFQPRFGPRRPLPAPVMVDCAALRAHRRLAQFLLRLLRIEDVILLGVQSNSASGCGPLMVKSLSFHFRPSLD